MFYFIVIICIALLNYVYSQHFYNGTNYDIDRKLETAATEEAAEEEVVTIPILSKPHFFLIGAMKCGTTSLHKLLIQHPQICGLGEKEKHYFDKDMTAADTKNYLLEFAKCPKNQFLIDSTPRYLAIDLVPFRISQSYTKEDLSKKKFMIILREPVSRHYSEYQFRVRLCTDIFDEDKGPSDDEYKNIRGNRNCKRVTKNYKVGIDEKSLEIMTFAEWVKSEDGSGEMKRGHYIEHIKEWLKIIRRDQLFIINFQSLITDTSDVMNRLSIHLGLSENWGKRVALPKPKEHRPSTFLDCETHDMLNKHYTKMNLELVRFVNSASDRPPTEPEFPEFASSRASCLKKAPNVDDDEVKSFDDENDDDNK